MARPILPSAWKDQYEPNPERDRALAHQYRNAPRYTVSAADLIKQFVKGPAARAAKRYAAIEDALREILPPAQIAKVRPTDLRGGVLTLSVADNVLLGELRQHREHALLAACARRGAAVSSLRYRRG